MALLNFEVSDDFLRRWTAMQNIEQWHVKVLEIGADIFARNLRQNLMQHYREGDLARAIKVQKPKRGKDGYYSISVYDKNAPSTNGTRNALKLAELEYGNSDQKATPVVAPARDASMGEFKQKATDYLSEYWGS